MCISVHCITSKGKYHEKNEDNYFVGDNLVIVADGMGGESDGDIASRITVDTVSKALTDNTGAVSDGELKDIMFSAIKQADDNISKYIDLHPESFGMGATVLLMIYRDDRVYLAWCGDSRCYIYKAGKLHSLTKDHSYVQELIDAKKISVDESFSHPDNNLITRFVGGGKAVCVPEYVSYSMNGPETIILCSDGLSGYCNNTEIERTIGSCRDMASLPMRLKELSIRRGSDDDITIVTVTRGKVRSRHNRFSILDWFRRNCFHFITK